MRSSLHQQIHIEINDLKMKVEVVILIPLSRPTRRYVRYVTPTCIIFHMLMTTIYSAFFVDSYDNSLQTAFETLVQQKH